MGKFHLDFFRRIPHSVIGHDTAHRGPGAPDHGLPPGHSLDLCHMGMNDLRDHLWERKGKTPDQLLSARYEKFRKIGIFQETG